MNKFFGKKAQILTGIVTFLVSLFIAAKQIFMFGNLLNYYINIPVIYGIILVGIILSVYITFGGIKAVTFTDVFHFIILIIVFPLVATYFLKKLEAIKHYS